MNKRHDSFQELVNTRHGEGGVGSIKDAAGLALIPRNDWPQHMLPAIGAVNIAGTKRAAFQISKLIEDEEWMITGTAEVSVPNALLLFAMRGADAGIQVEDDATTWTAFRNLIDPMTREIGRALRGSRALPASSFRIGPSGSVTRPTVSLLCRR